MDITVRSSLLVVVLTLGGCGSGGSSKAAPDFRVEQALPPAKQVTMKDMRGKVVLLDFWATWCGPCKESMPKVEAMWQAFKDKGLEVMAISDEKRADIRAFIPTSGVTYPFYVDIYQEANTRFNIEGIPALFLIDKAGNVVFQHMGSDIDTGALKSAIESALAAK